MAVKQRVAKADKDDLLALMNVGRAMREDFTRLGINTVADLARQDADSLYRELNRISGCRHDPCVWDVFAATIHQARTGQATPWWQWTAERKARQAAGSFVA